MDFSGIWMETSRLIVRELEAEDVCDMYAYLSQQDTTRFLTFAPHQRVDETLVYMQQAFLSYQQQGVPQALAICMKETGLMIGHMNIHTLEDGIGELGYVLHPAYWHAGYMKEALQVLIDLSFQWLHLRKLHVLYAEEHTIGTALAAACGFQQEGILRRYARLSDGQYHDMVIAGLLREEWKGSIL